jgi:hypothetical protein
MDGLDKKTFFRLAPDDGRPAVAAPQQGVTAVEQQAAFVFARLRGMTALAAFGEDRANLAFEMLDVRRRVSSWPRRLVGSHSGHATDSHENDG